MNGQKNGFVDKKSVFYSFFTIKELGHLEKDRTHKCLTSLKVEVIDFDETEKNLRKIKKRNSRSSCDAVKFVIDKENAEIHLIETKSILNFDKDPKIKSWKDRIKKIDSFKFYKKIADSLDTMSDIIEHKNMALKKDEKNDYYKAPKFPIFLVDLDKRTEIEDSFKFTLDFLSLENELYKVKENDSQNLQEAKLAFCGHLDEVYED